MTQEIITVIRPSFKKICAGSSCQAAVFNHALYWIAQKCKEGCNYWYDTGENIYHALAETWGISIIRREINALVNSHLIGETNNPKWGADRTKHFYFGEEQATTLFQACAKHEVCLFCIGLPEDVLALIAPHLIDLTNASIRFNKCICQNHQMQMIDLLNASDRSITAITKISSKITYKEKDTKERVTASASPPSPSFSSDTESHSHPVTVDTAIPTTDDATSASTGQADVIPIAMGTMKPDDKPNEAVTQASSDMVGVRGYEKGVSDESGTDSIWDRDARSAARDSDLLPAAERPFTRGTQDQAIQETQTAQVTQQTPLLQTMASALSSDARESNVTPPVAPLVLLTTLQQTSLLGDMPLDALLSQPQRRIDVKALLAQVRGRTTETIRASADTSQSDAASQPTETATMKPASQNKTVQTGGNKKTRGKSEAPAQILLEAAPIEPDMHGIWNHEKVIQYTEWCLGERYRDTERTRQLNAAKAIHKDDFKLTLEDYKDAYDERNDEWWHEVKGQLHVSHMRGKEKDSGIDRLHAMLGKIAARKAKGTTSPSSAPLGGMYRDKTAELAAERKKYLHPSSEAVAPRIVASATSFSYTR